MSTEENRRVRPTLLRSLSAFRAKVYSSPRSSAWRLKLPNINADKVAARPAHVSALRGLFPIAQWLADKPAHILEFQRRQRPLDRKARVPQCRQNASATRGGRPIRVKVHGSVLHAMSRVGLGAAWRQGSEQGLEAEFEIAHGHDAVDGALAELGGQGEDFGGDPAQVAVLLFQAVQLLAPLVLNAM